MASTSKRILTITLITVTLILCRSPITLNLNYASRMQMSAEAIFWGEGRMQRVQMSGYTPWPLVVLDHTLPVSRQQRQQ